VREPPQVFGSYAAPDCQAAGCFIAWVTSNPERTPGALQHGARSLRSRLAPISVEHKECPTSISEGSISRSSQRAAFCKGATVSGRYQRGARLQHAL